MYSWLHFFVWIHKLFCPLWAFSKLNAPQSFCNFLLYVIQNSAFSEHWRTVLLSFARWHACTVLSVSLKEVLSALPYGVPGQGLTHRLDPNLICCQRWPWASDPPASASQVEMTGLYYRVLGTEPRASCIVGKHFTTWATAPFLLIYSQRVFFVVYGPPFLYPLRSW